MSGADLHAGAVPTPRDPADAADALRLARGTSPNQRAWARFKRNRLGYASLWLFIALLVVSTLAELVSNDVPYVARIDVQLITFKGSAAIADLTSSFMEQSPHLIQFSSLRKRPAAEGAIATL